MRITRALVRKVFVLVRDYYRAVIGSYRITVDPQMPLDCMLARCGFCDIDPGITEHNFPRPGGIPYKVRFVVLRLSKKASEATIHKELAERGLCHATLWELLAFVASNSLSMQSYTLIEFGSLTRVPGAGFAAVCFKQYGQKRYLTLPWLGGTWESRYLIAAVRP